MCHGQPYGSVKKDAEKNSIVTRDIFAPVATVIVYFFMHRILLFSVFTFMFSYIAICTILFGW